MELKIVKSKEDGKDERKYVQKRCYCNKYESPGVRTLRLSQSILFKLILIKNCGFAFIHWKTVCLFLKQLRKNYPRTI